MRESLRRFEPLALSLVVVMLLFNASCPPDTTVTVPSVANDPPDVVLDVHYPQGPMFTVTPAGVPAGMPMHVNGNDELSLAAACIDDDSGCKDIQIHVDAVTTAVNGTKTSVGLSTPFARNQDANAVPGGTALKRRSVTAKLDVAQLRGGGAVLTLPIAVHAINGNDQVASTQRFALFWTQQPPLILPPCPGFLPAGDPPPPSPEVLDSRAVTIALQDLRPTAPIGTTFTIGVRHPTDPTIAWNLKITEVIGMAPTTATFTLDNKTGWLKELRTFFSCSSTVVQRLTATAGVVSGPITVTSADTTSIVLSRGRTGPFDIGVDDIALWNQASFWPAFGGKTTTITWIQ